MGARGTTLAAGVSFLDGLAGSFVEFSPRSRCPHCERFGGDGDVRVAAGATNRLARPHGNVTVKNGGILLLSAGQYVFRSVTLQDRARS